MQVPAAGLCSVLTQGHSAWSRESRGGPLCRLLATPIMTGVSPGCRKRAARPGPGWLTLVAVEPTLHQRFGV